MKEGKRETCSHCRKRSSLASASGLEAAMISFALLFAFFGAEIRSSGLKRGFF